MKYATKPLIIFSSILASFAIAADTAAQTKSAGYHSQDVRNISSDLHITYAEPNDTFTLGGQYGDEKTFSVGGDFILVDVGDNQFAINGQFNINKNFLINGEYNFERESLVFGGDYAQGVSFGVFNVGADYAFYDNIDNELSITGGLLVPFAKAFYYRGDLSYGFEYENFEFANKVGWTNGQFDANLSYTFADNDDYFALQGKYLF